LHGREIVPGGILAVRDDRFQYALLSEEVREEEEDGGEPSSRKTLATPTGFRRYRAA
jgi:hypothetical protein